MGFFGAAGWLSMALLFVVCLFAFLVCPGTQIEDPQQLTNTYWITFSFDNTSIYGINKIKDERTYTLISKSSVCKLCSNIERIQIVCSCDRFVPTIQQLSHTRAPSYQHSQIVRKYTRSLECNSGWSLEHSHVCEEYKNSTNNEEISQKPYYKQVDVFNAVILICTLFYYIDKKEVFNQVCLNKGKNFFNTSTRFNFMRYKTEVPEYLFKFRMKRAGRHVTIAYPFSLNQYAEEVVRQNRTGEALMKFEWARYMSFKTFPQDSIMTPMRLSQAGYFYTGRGEEVKCFCCGVMNDQWSREETAIQVHARLSPRCAFINDQDTDNVTIHASEYYQSGFQPQEDGRQHVGRIRPQAGASGGPSDRLGSNQSSSGEQSARRNGRGDNTPPPAGNIRTVPQNGNKRTERISPETPVNRSQAKHPEYERFETRLDTFSKWTMHDIQDPRVMAETGLFYTYIRDFVRCYYCGIGLKNWERGDNPQEEHKRWSPSCGFLLQNSSQVSAQTRENTRPGVTQNAENASTSCTAAPSTSATNTVQPNRPSNTGSTAEGATSGGENNVTPTSRVAKPDAKVERKVIENSSTSSASSGAPSERSSLVDENRNLRAQMTCKICLDRDSNVVFLPCGHMTACKECAQSLRKCAICRKLIRGSVIVYQS